MRRHSMPEMKEGGVNVTPLIDIVMCLIIFFMLVTKVGVDTGSDRSIHVPASLLGTDLKGLGNTLTINVNNGPDIPGDQQPSINFMAGAEKQELKIHSANGQQTLAEMLKYRKSINPDFKVNIRAHENTQYMYLEPVLNECASVSVPYNFATQEPKRSKAYNERAMIR